MPASSNSERRLSRLRDELLDAQERLFHASSGAVAVIVTGLPAAGRTEVINELVEWLDPKRIAVHAFAAPDRHDRQRPAMWRYWRTLPARSRMTFYFAGWYGDCLFAPLHAPRKRQRETKRALQRICRMEAMLHADGIHVVKIHLHIDRKTQRERLARLRADKLTRWRVTYEDRRLAMHYKEAVRAAKQCLKASDHPLAPWHRIDGTNEDERLLRVGEIVRDALQDALRRADEKQTPPVPEGVPKRKTSPRVQPVEQVTDDEYDHELERLQGRLALLVRRPRMRKHAVVLAFEGMDAAGKGGAIRRITHALDARQYQVVPVGAPTPEERLYPYLWRFWRHVPARGAITIFDRSWYGRVLVERVRGFAAKADWRRAYDEINDFELQLTEHGIVVAKFWLAVGKAEQLRRFEERNADPLKRFKVDEEDWINRRHYDAYQAAAAEMIERTDNKQARWHAIAADDKKSARLQVLRAVCEAIEREVK